MSDYGIFRAIQEKLKQIHPSLKIVSQHFLDEKPPYAILQKDRFERKPPPFKTGSQKMILTLMSRFKGEAEIQKLYQQACAGLEGLNLVLEEGVSGQIILNENHLSLEKDNLTRAAHINFTVRLKFQ